MVLSKSELISSLQHEVRVLLHLASKVDPAQLDYRPTPRQRSTIELLRYLTIMGPIHLHGARGKTWDIQTWLDKWNREEAVAKTLTLDEVKESIAKQSALFADVIGACSDVDLRAEIALFGRKATRGTWLVRLVLCHYPAYRMQLFMHLKACGQDELNTMNLWAGMDQP